MGNESFPNEQQKKKRGRPVGSHSMSSGTASQQKKLSGKRLPARSSSAPTKATVIPSSTTEEDDLSATPFCAFLRSIMQHDRAELARVARELSVAENTVYRWMNGTSEPRAGHLKKLPAAIPTYSTQLTAVINQTFGDILSASVVSVHEVRKEVYQNVLEIGASSQDDDTRFWHVTECIFEEALRQLDSERHGLAITYARLMSTHEDGIHSLREVRMRGHTPWADSMESRVFLGVTSMVGSAAISQRIQIWNNKDGDRTLVEIDEHEHSACAVPVRRGNLLAGVLVVSSTQSDFFKDSTTCQIVAEYALLMGVALCDRDFHPSALLHLRPMPPLGWQRKKINHSYLNRIITYARTHQMSRRDAEFWIEREMELEFEEEAHRLLVLRGQDQPLSIVSNTPSDH
ncbi:hypothetical protein KDA_24230 [Dictyobacter alpinus]|uniref:GAF domain-containing protein n=1 Tax=Dictyobacter alpinus TaxID=2014873 RepID=A0A402B6H5_9CHLR|nr:GAF domain-containing protein [Dictyobacter alpinus]GCE26939.1 hypothetical protein KDA_24230 [Dictyobacter alpinus]